MTVERSSCPPQYVGEAALCDRVAVMARGRLVAYDAPDALRRRAFGGDVYRLTPDGGEASTEDLRRLRSVPCVVSAERDDDHVRVLVADGAEPASLANAVAEAGVGVQAIEPAPPTFDEVFVVLLRTQAGEQDGAS